MVVFVILSVLPLGQGYCAPTPPFLTMYLTLILFHVFQHLWLLTCRILGFVQRYLISIRKSRVVVSISCKLQLLQFSFASMSRRSCSCSGVGSGFVRKSASKSALVRSAWKRMLIWRELSLSSLCTGSSQTGLKTPDWIRLLISVASDFDPNLFLD